MAHILSLIYWFIQSLFGWQREPHEGTVLRLPSEGESSIPIDYLLPTERIIAFVLQNDPFLYVIKDMEEVVAEQLKATIDGDIWQFKEDGKEIKREKKVVDIDIHDYMLSHAVLTVWDGFECLPLPAGSWISLLYRRRGWNSWKYKIAMQFKTNEARSWCHFNKRRKCNTVWGSFTGEFRRRRNGRWVSRRETHRMSSCNG